MHAIKELPETYAFLREVDLQKNRKEALLVNLLAAALTILLLNLLLPRSWFWVIYFLQIGNIAGAAGDIYVSWLCSKLNSTIYVKDTGVHMTIYDKSRDIKYN